jgi:hypothetical protein
MKVCPTGAAGPFNAIALLLRRVPDTLPSDLELSVGYVGISPRGLTP